MKSLGSTTSNCRRCGALLQLGSDVRPDRTSGRELIVPCFACGNECRVPLGGIPAGERDAAASGESAQVVLAEPPFRDLVIESDPPFKPLPEPTEPPSHKPTLAERWNALPSRWQKGIVACVVTVILVGGLFWPKPSEAYPPRPQQPELPPVNFVKGGDVIQVQPPPELRQYLVTRKPIPLNAEITPDNVKEYFEKVGVQNPPAGSLVSSEGIHGKFALRDVASGQFITSELFGEATIAPPPHVPQQEFVTIRVLTASGVTEYVFEQTATGYRQVSPAPFAKSTAKGNLP